MGALVGVPELLAMTVWVATGLSLVMVYGYWNIRRAHERVAARRPNPTKEEFLAALADDCSQNVADFLWEKALDYVRPRLTPHPDDDLIEALKIDGDDIALDWPREWAEKHGFHESNLPDWPKGWPATIRNYGRWLDMGPH